VTCTAEAKETRSPVAEERCSKWSSPAPGGAALPQAAGWQVGETYWIVVKVTETMAVYLQDNPQVSWESGRTASR
jgi:hypothetical protein